MALSWQMSLAVACGLCLVVLASAPVSSAAVLLPGAHLNATAAADQTVVIGSIGYQDRLLLQETAYKDSIWGIVRDADIVYPKKNELGYKISCIKIIDQRKDGKNGVTKVKEGGLGSNFAKLRFHSARGHSLNWVVQIYGH